MISEIQPDVIEYGVKAALGLGVLYIASRAANINMRAEAEKADKLFDAYRSQNFDNPVEMYNGFRAASDNRMLMDHTRDAARKCAGELEARLIQATK